MESLIKSIVILLVVIAVAFEYFSEEEYQWHLLAKPPAESDKQTMVDLKEEAIETMSMEENDALKGVSSGMRIAVSEENSIASMDDSKHAESNPLNKEAKIDPSLLKKLSGENDEEVTPVDWQAAENFLVELEYREEAFFTDDPARVNQLSSEVGRITAGLSDEEKITFKNKLSEILTQKTHIPLEDYEAQLKERFGKR